MIVSHKVFDTLLAHDGPDVSISFYHECLHSITFTHAKILSIPHHQFLDPDSPSAADGTVSALIGGDISFYLSFLAFFTFI